MHIEKMFELAGLPNGDQHARNILKIETQIASLHWDQVRDRDMSATYNKFSYEELQKLSTGFDWDLYLEAAQIPKSIIENVIVRQPSFFTGLGRLMTEFDVSAWSSWLQWHLLSGSAPFLNRDLVEENFSFFGRTVSGTPENRERWKRGVSIVEGVLGEAIGEIYVAKHFPPEAKARMLKLVNNLLKAYRIHIADLDWLTEQTKKLPLQSWISSHQRSATPIHFAIIPRFQLPLTICWQISQRPQSFRWILNSPKLAHLSTELNGICFLKM